MDTKQPAKKQTIRWILSILFLLALGYRIWALFQTPTVTTDAFRNLGYASHALDDNFNVYNTSGVQYDHEIWAKFNVWNELPYNYPPITLTFFYLFSLLGLGIFWVKLALTLIELASAFILYREVSAVTAVLFFIAPVSLWFTSHEGQFEALQTLFILLTVTAVSRRHWVRSGLLLALSIQVKLWGVLLLPWLAYQIWDGRKEMQVTAVVRKLLAGMGLGFLPFLGFYGQRPDLLFISVRGVTGSANVVYNPFAWNIFDSSRFGWNPFWLIVVNAFFTYLALLVLVIAGIKLRKLKNWFDLSPVFSFLVVLKSLGWAQFWYTLIVPGFMITMRPRKSLITLLLILYLLMGARSAALIAGYRFGRQEPEQNVALMASCMFRCDVQTTEVTH